MCAETAGTLEFKISAPAPKSKGKSVADNQSRAVERIVQWMQVFLDSLEPEDFDRVASQLEAATQNPSPDDPQGALAMSVSGREFSTEERLGLEFRALMQYFEWRRQLLESSLSAAQVAQLLGTSRQTPHDRLKNGTLIAILNKGVWRFPIWQFDPEGPDGVIPGLSEVLAALEVPLLSKLSWLVRPNPFLNGLKPIEALKQGQKERVIVEARGVGAK